MKPSSELPPTLSSVWRLCKLGYRHEPKLMLWAFVLSQISALPDAFIALWLMLLGRGVVDRRTGLDARFVEPLAESVPAVDERMLAGY